MPFDHKNPQPRLTLAGMRSPHVARIIGAELQRNIDVRKAHGHSGATAVFLGRENVRFRVVFELYDDQDWADWYALKPLLDKDPSKHNPKALDVLHPLLQDVAIKSVLIEKVTAPELNDGRRVDRRGADAHVPRADAGDPQAEGQQGLARRAAARPVGGEDR